MGIKQFFDRITGRTSSSNVEIKKRTHYTGELFNKQLLVTQSSAEMNRREKELDRKYPDEPKHKLEADRFLITFNLNLKHRPDDMKLWELLRHSQDSRSYKAYTENSVYYDGTVGRYVTGGPVFKGYKVADWLFIETELLNEFLPNSCINAFEVEYTESQIKVLHDKTRITQLAHVKVDGEKVDSFINKILINESVLFVRECTDIMSPN